MKKFLLSSLIILASGTISAQDTCADALPITAGLHTVAMIDGPEIPTPICANNGFGATSASEWYIYTPEGDYTVTITTDLPQNDFRDTRFHVYIGSCGALFCHGGDDDSGAEYTSTGYFDAMAGTTYYIAFDNRWTSTGFDFLMTEQEIIVPAPGLINFDSYSFGVPNGTKSCVVDMNNDYLDDIVVVNQSSVSVMYQSATGTGFTLATISTPVANFMPSWSLAAGDIDKNGYNDLLYGSGSGVTFMIQNESGTGFTEFSGVQNVFSQRSNFSDLNNDGHLDAFVCHDVAPNVYYINDGSGNLTYNQGGLGDFPSGGNYGSIFVDYDNDGDSDLFIAKCRGGNSGANIDELHRNDGGGDFTDVSVASGMAEISQSWSSAWGDFDNDGWMDALIGASSFANGGHKLRHNNGDGTFTDITPGSGFDLFTTTNIEHVAHDFDNDGFVDVFCGNNIIMHNNGNMTFSPLVVEASNGPVGDLNNDGFLDVQNESTVYMNTANENKWLKVTLKGIQSNGNGIGARIEIYGAWGKQIRDVRSGDGFRYMSSLNTHFGIGAATEIEKVVVRWPSGIVDVVMNPAVSQTLFVIEGSSPELGIGENNAAHFSIFPIPASEVLNIKTTDDALQLVNAEIFDSTGKKINSLKLEKMTVDVSGLPSGTYFMLLTDASGGKYPSKFIKQ